MLACVVYCCNNNNSLTNDSSIQYYPFPKPPIYEKWVEACGWPSGSIVSETARICSIHFEESAFCNELKLVDFVASYVKRLKHDAVPTLYLPETQIIIKENTLELENIKVIYDIDSAEDNEVTAGSIQDKQYLYIQPSTSTIKVETPMQYENAEDEKYSHIKNNLDLYQAQIKNKDLKRSIECIEKEVNDLEKILKVREKLYLDQEKEYKKMQIKACQNRFSSLDQKMILSKVFSESQIKILFGKKKIYWSNDDMAVGYTIRHLSNKRCYTYLTKTLNIPLPGLSSIKRWVTAKKDRKLDKPNKDNEETNEDITCKVLETGEIKQHHTDAADEQWISSKEDNTLENIENGTEILPDNQLFQDCEMKELDSDDI